MGWFLALIFLIIVAILVILFFNRYFRKATREVALVRTGAGGQQVVTDGGCLALPFLHKVSEVNMKTSRLEIARLGPKSIITKDRLRVDIGAEFYVRVDPSDEGVATAAQALGGKSFRSSELEETLEGKLVDAMLAVAAGYTMDSLQDNRGQYSAEVTEILAPNLRQNGLVLESVSITRLDQTPFHALDENNAFNALGMRRLSEIIAVNKKERAAIEADAEVSVRQSQLEATKRRLLIDQQEEEAKIAQNREIETARAKSMADVAQEQASSDTRRDAARIEAERETRAAEIAKERELNRQRLEADLSTQSVKHENEVALAAKRIEEAEAAARFKAAEAQEAAAQELVTTAREKAAAEREKELALIRAKEAAEVDDTRVASEAGTVVAMAEAEAKAARQKAEATKKELLDRAEGVAALVAAENAQSGELMRHKLDEARLKALPGVVERMMKPTEKIDSIRINHITGMGQSSAGGGSPNEGNGVTQVVDGVLNMALQLPAVKKLGEEIGVNIADGVKGVTGPLESPSDDTPKETKDDA